MRRVLRYGFLRPTLASMDGETKQALNSAAEDLEQAAELAGQKQKYYTGLADKLISVAEQVAVLSGQYCDDASRVGGKHQRLASRWGSCAKPEQFGTADELQLMLDQSKLDDSVAGGGYLYYWQRKETDAYNHTLSEILGNGLVNRYEHHSATGRPGVISTKRDNSTIRELHYQYDVHNNVTYRADLLLGITDSWDYDALDRVERNTIALADKTRHGIDNPDLNRPFSYQYNKLGNLRFKTGMGDYQYDKKKAGPHAVTRVNGLNHEYDKAGNLLRAYRDNGSNERVLNWTEFNKPSSISRNGNKVEFYYDANHNRYLKKSSDGSETFYFGKSYERIKNRDGEVQHKHFVYADGKLIALNTQSRDKDNKLENKQVRYLHYDALNSVDMITDGYGKVVERRSYDTWGKQRKVVWQNLDDPGEVLQHAITNRGYTGHEEITEVDLIHMNGRVYDAELGRFLSADPLVQAPYLTNSFNRYSYVMNNPLKYTDPTGYEASGLGGFGGGECVSDNSGGSSSTGKNGCNTGVREEKSPFSGGSDNDSPESPTTPQDKVKADVGATPKEEVLGEKNASLLENNHVVAIVLAKAEMNGNLQQAIKGLNLSEERLGELEPLVGNYRSAITIVGSISIVSVRTGGLTMCFVEGTLIHTQNGLRPIEEIEVGDFVESKDEITGEKTWKPVTKLFRNHNKLILNLTLENETGSTELLGVTLEHPFWVEDEGWTEAAALSEGQSVQDINGKFLKVKSVELDDELHDTYNFEVADYHSYFVGELGAWVHNQCDVPKKLTRAELDDIATLRTPHGEVLVSDIDQARKLLDNMPELKPATQNRSTPNPSGGLANGFKDPKGTYRGDLINKSNPSGPVHPGVQNPNHANYPHYNITQPNGNKSAIIIKGN